MTRTASRRRAGRKASSAARRAVRPAPPSRADGKVRLVLDAATYHPDSVLEAAHVLAARARVWLRKVPRGTEALVEARGSVSSPGLGEEFLDEVSAQELRRRIAERNRPIREYIVTQALLAASGPAHSGASRENAPLSAADEEEIDRLIREAEKEIEGKIPSGPDDEGIGRTWEQSRAAHPRAKAPPRP